MHGCVARGHGDRLQVPATAPAENEGEWDEGRSGVGGGDVKLEKGMGMLPSSPLPKPLAALSRLSGL